MKILDLNGKVIKNTVETAELKNLAEERLMQFLDTIEHRMAHVLEDYKEFESLHEAIAIPFNEFRMRMEALKRIIKTGTLETHFLGITQEEDYSDMRKDLLKEMMYFIENNNLQGESDD